MPGKDYKIETLPEKVEKEEEQGLPVYMERLSLSEEQKKRFIEEVFRELDVIKEERKSAKLDKKWDSLDCQYEGKIAEDTRRQFNLMRNITKDKVDKIVKYLRQAFFEVDPVFSVSPRPKFGKGQGVEVCVQQQDFLDYKVDNLPFEPEMDLVFHSAVVKGTGILEIYHDIQSERRRREEVYEPKLSPVMDPVTKGPKIDPQTQLPIFENFGLKEFLSNWPNAPKDYPGLVRKLADGQVIRFVVDYKEVTYNDPRPKFIDLKDFYVRLNTEGYHGLKTTKLIAVRENYTYWELKKEEAQSKFYDIDELVYDEKGPENKVKNYESLDFDILKCTFYFKINEKDDEETKVVCWVDEKKKIIIGSILYPYFAIASNYLPFYIKRKNKGFYQPSMAEDLTDNDLAQSAILNLTLETAYIQNTVTPITNKSEIQNQFLEKRFAHGLPIFGSPKDIDFLQKYMRPADIGGLVTIMQILSLGADDKSGISAGMSGKENPMDPAAPASKTIALLKAASIDINDYIRHIIQSFNEIAYILLAMYYQMTEEGVEYAVNPERVVGDNPFGVIERNTMIARTNIQARALAFDFDKVQEKATDMALYQLLRFEPLFAKNPEAVYTTLKQLVDGWSPKWKNISNRVLPSLPDFKKMQLQTALQAVAFYVKAEVDKARVTGVAPEFDINKLLPVIADLQAQLVTPVDEKAVKQEQEASGV